ncbi:phage portal protein [Streptomyces sp. V1I1]|uniref:phage portal protein n=1 Tax=Streptomyces sp. V1I1 TaxID=3042272 RepID=UPI002781BFEA|nr:phage portal protein [Streptomyces sp. V1I1]MDQ0943279.1 A118 family predicted phage portal protein [Streptomyces sp. V1I1]
MPLPENNTAWPPQQYAAQLADMRIDDAWYAGDKTKLRKVYSLQGYDNGNNERDGNGRPWRFWERPRPVGRRDNRLHVPLPADIAAKSAALLFAEAPTWTFENDTAQDRWAQIAEAGGLDSTLREAAEVSAALGGVALRATWNQDLAKRPLITAVHADGVLPDWQFGVMTGITLWREVARSGNTVLRHLERHEPGKILHALYEGTLINLGMRVPLTESPDTEGIAESLDADGPGDTITTGVQGLTCVYIPNMRPNRKFRGSMLGRSDWQHDGIRDLFMSLDETYTSWMRDIRLAKARLVIPSGFLTSQGPGKGASFDEDQELYSEINASPTSGEGLTLVQFAIRVAEHEQSWRSFSRKAVESAGYAAQSFGLGDSTAITATEVVSQERSSLLTSDQKGGYWLPGLGDLADVVLQLDKRLGFSSVAAERPQIELADSVSEDAQTKATTVELFSRAQAMSTEMKVRYVHPEWEDAAVKEETDRILKETGALVNDPAMTGAEGPGAPGFGEGGGEAD